MARGRVRKDGLSFLKLSVVVGLRLGLAFLLLTGTRSLGQESSGRSRNAPVLQHSAGEGEPSLTRGPYLQSVTTDHVLVVWETDQPATSRVDYGPTAEHGFVVSSAVTVTHHVLTMTGLKPYTAYYY
ncbi:MAG: hypothetical protein DRI48_02930 [Chloroflexi bacterium]|nr:MAG: hypothetical protein DRI48_02930 [Chloroflexota bacterium]